MGNPELSFTVATRLFVSIMKNVGLDLVKIAASYNSGKFRCKAGATNLFGNVENQGYAERVVTFANTSVRLGLGSEVNSSEVTLNNLVGVGLLAVAGYLLYKMYLVK